MTRVISGAVLAAAALAGIFFLPPLGLLLLACVVAFAAAAEYERVAGLSHRSLRFVAAYTCFIVGAGSFNGGAFGVLLLLMGFGVAGAVLRGEPIQSAATAVYGLVYVGVPLGLLPRIHALGGREAVLLLLGAIVVSDTAQYYTGRLFGRRPLAPAISPKKTIEGAVGGLVIGTAFVTWAGSWVFPFARPAVLAAMGLGLVLLGIAGDLFESRLKRTAGLKDSSALIPGHGGVLDRIDALLFASPVFYLFLHELM